MFRESRNFQRPKAENAEEEKGLLSFLPKASDSMEIGGKSGSPELHTAQQAPIAATAAGLSRLVVRFIA